MAARVPGASDIHGFWRNLRDGVESIRVFSDDEVLAAGVDPRLLEHPQFVKAAAVLDDIDHFDAELFGFSAVEARLLDPQHRLFLECAWTVLEHAGCDPHRYDGAIGVFAGVMMNGYLHSNLAANPAVLESAGVLATRILNDKDFLSTRLSYLMNLRGPSLTVQTACSTSLVAVHLACQSLLAYDSDMALAGGVSIPVPQTAGYLYQEGGIFSPDGHCRAFDAEAKGTVGGSGVGLVALKRLEDALDDGDIIHAVILGSAINNDGSAKVGYTAPSVDAQSEVIAAAQSFADIEPGTITYVEAHGTGTTMGDPIEIEALSEVFSAGGAPQGGCAIGSVKSNFGHLDAAAGVVGMIKTILALKHQQIPPTLHCRTPNPRIDFPSTPFTVATELRPWDSEGPRRGAVSSFGVGGTNAHAILEEAPDPPVSGPASRAWQLLPLSAASEASLDGLADSLASHFEGPGAEGALADAAWTLQVGRQALERRRVVLARGRADAAAVLRGADPQRSWRRADAVADRRVAFLLPGQGAQHARMGEGLRHEPIYRRALERCAALARPHLGVDLLGLLDAPEGSPEAARLGDTEITQPALFAVEWAVAEQWRAWGVEPWAMLGHSLGEWVAATLAGVFALEDVVPLVVLRGRLMGDLPGGAMLGVELPADTVEPMLTGDLALAAVNAPQRVVVSGSVEAIDALGRGLGARGVETRRLHTSHAFHSPMVEPILERFEEAVAAVPRQAPTIPFVSNVTGEFITESEATDPRYWARHLRSTVRFAQGLSTLVDAQQSAVLLDIGPGRSLAQLARGAADTVPPVVSGMRHPKRDVGDLETVLGAVANLWTHGVRIDWASLHGDDPRMREELPTYVFDRRRHWVDPDPSAVRGAPRILVVEAGASAEAVAEQLRAAGHDVTRVTGAEDALEAVAGPPPTAPPSVEEVSPKAERPSLGAGYAAPQSNAEERLVAVWEEMLGVAPIGRHDDFFDLGGHSLLATRLVSRVRDELGLTTHLDAFFTNPTVAGLAALWHDADGSAESDTSEPGIVPMPRGDELPLSYAQERIWFLDRLEPGNPALNIPAAVGLEGAVHPQALDRALGRVVERHESLRTVFEDRGGRAVQRILPVARVLEDLKIQHTDLSAVPDDERSRHLEKVLDAEARRPFDLERGPLWRCRLVRLAPEHHVLALCVHHVVSDGWSMGLLVRELAAYYIESVDGTFPEGLPEPEPLPVQVVDHAFWQRRWLESAACDREIEYWRGCLGSAEGGAPAPLQLPTDRPRGQLHTYRGARRVLDLPPSLGESLEALGRRHGVTLFMTLLAATKVLLARWSGQDDVVVGAPIAGRDRSEIEGLIGIFLNSLALRTDLGGDPSFETLLRRVQSTAVGAYGHQRVPFERLLEELQPERDLSRTPIFQVFFNMPEFPFDEVELGGLRFRAFDPPEVGAKFDLTVYVFDRPGGLRIDWVYNADLFDGARIDEGCAQLRRLLEAVVAEPSAPISRHALAPAEVQQAMLAPRPAVTPMPSLVERLGERVAHDPRATAVVGEDDLWSYGDLWDLSGRLAGRLRALGVEPGSVVAVWAQRSPALVCALLAIRRASAAWMILDPGQPVERLSAQGHLVRPAAWLELVDPNDPKDPNDGAPGPSTWIRELGGVQTTLPQGRVAAQSALEGVPPIEGTASADPADLAYITFTSGTGGRPKAIRGSEGPLVHFFQWQHQHCSTTGHTRVSMLSGLGHDPLLRDLFAPLWAGGTLCVPEASTLEHPARLRRWLAEQRITMVHLTPSLAEWVLGGDGATHADALEDLRWTFFGGERLREGLVVRWRTLAPRTACVNLYGATETPQGMAYHTVDALASDGQRRGWAIPIGRGIDPTVEVWVADGNGRPAAVGELGEILVHTPHLALGYLGGAEDDEARFGESPYGAAGWRLYRTGDLGRVLPGGDVVYVGRRDRQVQLRGYRIELSEIEAALLAQPDIDEAVVDFRDGRLVAWAVGSGAQGSEAGESLAGGLRRHLPEAWIPSPIVRLESLPRTVRGKVDLAALDVPDALDPGLGQAPLGPLEEHLALLCCELLDLERIGREQSFFALGGHSLLASRLLARIERDLGVELPLRTLFEAPTVAELAQHLRPLLPDSETSTAASDDAAESARASDSDARRHQCLVEWNDTAHPIPDANLYGLFLTQAAERPEATAVVAGDAFLTYGELAALAELQARALVAAGLGPDTLVAICAERSLELMVGLLGILGAGGAYVPLDPGYPAERLTFLLEDVAHLSMAAGCPRPVLLHGPGAEAVLDRAEAFQPMALGLADLLGRAESIEALEPRGFEERPPVDPDQLAYAIYTSGSTGKPKGAGISHRAIVNRLLWMQETFGLGPDDRVLQKTPYSFDVSVWELFWPMITGARLVMAEPGAHGDPFYLERTIRQQGITTLHFVPSMLAVFVDHIQLGDDSPVRRVVTSGEALGQELARRAHRSLRAPVHNLYGPTEAAVDVSWWPCEPDDGRKVPIGRPVWNTQLIVVDPRLQPTPLGEPGELLIGGVQLARGYLGRPGLTAERFVPDPISTMPGARMYRTGDLTRHLPQGEIDFLGRLDHQVKIRGQRIELGEIEACLAADPTVEQAVVCAMEDRLGDTALVAFVVASSGADAATDATDATDTGWIDHLRRELRSTLPSAMVPAQILRRTAIPLGPTGKADRKRLMAEVDGGTASTELVADPSRLGTPQPLSYSQERLWLLDRLAPGHAAYHLTAGVLLDGPVDIRRLEAAVSAVVARHGSLRTRFVDTSGEPRQVVEGAVDLPLSRLDVSNLTGEAQAAALHQLGRSLAAAPFALDTAPLARFVVVRLAPERHAVLAVVHHIVTDGWSMGILIRELVQAYRTPEGATEPWPPLDLHYVDYAAWQRRTLRAEALEASLAPWVQWLTPPPAALTLPLDRPRPAVPSHRGGRVSMHWDVGQRDALLAWAQRHGATLYMATLTGFVALLARYADQRDVVLGTPVAHRNPHVEGLIGFFVNTLALRFDVETELDAGALLGRVRDRVLEALAHQDAPFEKLVERLRPRRSLDRSPLFQVMFAFQRAETLLASSDEALRVEPLDLETGAAKLDLELRVIDGPEGLQATLEFATDLFDPSTAERLLRHWMKLLEGAVASPGAPLSRVSWLDAAERAQVSTGWTPTAAELQALGPMPADHPAGTPLVVLDAWGEPQPWGAVGEIHTAFDDAPQPTGQRGRRLTDGSIVPWVPFDPWEASPELGDPSEAPLDAVEERLHGLFSEVLDLPTIGRRQSFFDLGGHSLLAARLQARIHRELDVPLELREIFESPTIAALAARLRGHAPGHPVSEALWTAPFETEGIEPGVPVPLSFAQERLWLVQQLDTESVAYNLPMAVRLRGALDVERLASAVDRVTARQGSLRTRFVLVEGEPRQVVEEAVPSLFDPSAGDALVDLTHLGAHGADDTLRAHIEGVARHPFDLTKAPLARIRLVRLAPDHHILVAVMHHSISDGWSMGLWVREITEFYGALAQGDPGEPIQPLPIQYVDYAAWQRRHLTGAAFEVQVEYWLERLASPLPEVELPWDRPRPAMASGRGGQATAHLSSPTRDALRALGHAHGATLYMVLCAAFNALLVRLGNPRGVVIGTPVAHRRRIELEGLIGFFANTLVLRTDLSGAPSFVDGLGETRATLLEALAHQDVPFEQVVDRLNPERRLDRTPVFQVMFSHQDAPAAVVGDAGLEVEALGMATGTAKFDLELQAADSPEEGLVLALAYATDLFDHSTAERFLGYFQELLDSALATPHRALGALNLWSAVERHQLLVEFASHGSALPLDTELSAFGETFGESVRVPTGGPVEGIRLYVCDGFLRPVPVGVVGELCVGGHGVDLGHLTDPRRIASVSVPNPSVGPNGLGEPGDRLYRTGDRARWLPNGDLEFLGCVGHQALPGPAVSKDPEPLEGGPRTPTEDKIFDIWQQVLAREDIARGDNFFDLGGNSLVAVQALARLREAFDVELSLRQLFEHPTLAGQAAWLESLGEDAEERLPAMVPRPAEAPLLASYDQERLWLAERLQGGGHAYNMTSAVELEGPLKVDALAAALAEVEARHGALRTVFEDVGGKPRPRLVPTAGKALPRVDLSALPEARASVESRRLAQADAQRPFDLVRGPVWRATLLHRAPERHILLFAIHHIASDAWSLEVLKRELAALYGAFATGQPSPLEPLEVQYSDYAAWQRELLKGSVFDRRLNYWRRQLGGAPSTLALPYDRPVPERPSDRGGVHRFELPAAVGERLESLAREVGATSFAVLASLLQVLLHQHTRQDDLTLATDYANREGRETEALIGFFVNLVILRLRLDPDEAFIRLLERNQHVLLESFQHQVPFPRLVEALRPERRLGTTPFAQVLLVLNNVPRHRLETGDLVLSPLSVEDHTSKFHLGLFVDAMDGRYAGTWRYSTDRFDATTIATLSSRFEDLAAALTKAPERALRSFDPADHTRRKKNPMAKSNKAAKLAKLKKVKPQAVDTNRELVEHRELVPGSLLPLILEPTAPDVDLNSWALNHLDFIDEKLQRHGGLLFRGFGLRSVTDFEGFAKQVCPSLFGDYGDLPREEEGQKVYHSTPYPADKSILFHNESSHMHRWPLKQFFFCLRAAAVGGETPVVDCRRMAERLPEDLRQRFVEKRLMYVRTFMDGLDVRWQDFFKTENREEVEAYCREAGLGFEWLEGGGLQTQQVCPALAVHPKTGEVVFFNQLQLHHVASLEPEVRASLTDLFGEDRLPRQVRYGDGSPIDDATMAIVTELYDELTVTFRWQEGDLLMVDNMLTAHGRYPFEGERKIVVAMGEMVEATKTVELAGAGR